ncbi:unnamed protein product [Urochloa humidicola]
MADGGCCLPDDVLVHIFLRVPTWSRRELRLVCKGWRSAIDERAPPEDKLPAKILVFINQGRTSTALVFDGGSHYRTRAWTYTSSSADGGGGVRMVVTCNGLLCLHDHTTYGGFSFSAVTVTNPVTGETVALPAVPTRWAWSQFAKAPGHYSFGFHPGTKLHKVVHIPRGHRRSLDALHVFTLGGDNDKAAWREVPVPVPGACHGLLCDPVSVAGAAGRVMALDLGDERVSSLAAPPASATAAEGCRLTKVGASLGVVVPSGAMYWRGVEVWVLDRGGGGRPLQWNRRYRADETMESSWVVAPQLTHGDFVLSAEHEWEWDYASFPRRNRSTTLRKHEVGELVDSDGDRWQLPPANGSQLIMSSDEREGEITTFAYVETWNPVPRSSDRALYCCFV